MMWRNWAELIAGIWVLASPWILGFSAANLAMLSNVIVGAIIIVLALWKIFGNEV